VRIQINIDRLRPTGGVEVNVLQVGRELARRGLEIDLFFTQGGEFESEYRTFCRSMTRVPGFYIGGKRHALRDVTNVLRSSTVAGRSPADVLYINRYEESMYGLITGRHLKAPTVVHLHGPMAQRRVHQRLDGHVRRYVAVSNYVKRHAIERGFKPEWVDVVHNGIDPKEYPVATDDQRLAARSVLGLPASGAVALFYGRLDPDKGVEVLLDAWARLGLTLGDGALLIAGEAAGPNRQVYEAHLRQLGGRADTVHWTGFRRDVSLFLQAADIVIMPSVWQEPFGRVVIEGMAGGVPEILTGDFAPWLFDAGDAAALASLIGSLLSWRSQRPQLASACHLHVKQNFTLRHCVDGIERVLLDAAT
jgi:glycosyltransferase involved in cell wall biosynthesis